MEFLYDWEEIANEVTEKIDRVLFPENYPQQEPNKKEETEEETEEEKKKTNPSRTNSNNDESEPIPF